MKESFLLKGVRSKNAKESNSKEGDCFGFKAYCCGLPQATEVDEPVYDTYAQVEEDSNTEDRSSHLGVRPAHPPVHNVQGFTHV